MKFKMLRLKPCLLILVLCLGIGGNNSLAHASGGTSPNGTKHKEIVSVSPYIYSEDDKYKDFSIAILHLYSTFSNIKLLFAPNVGANISIVIIKNSINDGEFSQKARSILKIPEDFEFYKSGSEASNSCVANAIFDEFGNSKLFTAIDTSKAPEEVIYKCIVFFIGHSFGLGPDIKQGGIYTEKQNETYKEMIQRHLRVLSGN